MSLDVDVEHARRRLPPRRALRPPQPGVTALFGRSGSGKTTLVNIVAGLIRPQRGRIVVDGETLVDTDARRLRAAAPPPRRLRLPGRPPVPASQRAPEPALRPLVLARRRRRRRRLRLDRRAARHRPPARAPAGTRCRAARSSASRSAARCSPSPRLLLMDEPLASLDEARQGRDPALHRAAARRDRRADPLCQPLRRRGGAARDHGRHPERGQGHGGRAGARHPAARRWRATAAACSKRWWPATTRPSSSPRSPRAAGELQVPQLAAAVGATVRAYIRSRDVMLSLQPPQDISALNVLAGKVAADRRRAARRPMSGSTATAPR